MWPVDISMNTMEFVGALTCGGCCYMFYKIMCSQQETVQAMKDAPDVVTSLLLSQGNDVLRGGLTGYIRGAVHPVTTGGGIKAYSNTNITGSGDTRASDQGRQKEVTGVISVKTTTELIMTQIFGIWSNNERILNVEQEAVPFYIVGQDIVCTVQEPLELYTAPLQVVSESYEAPTRGFFSSMMALLQGFHSTGIKHTQEMLVSGTEVIGLGRLVLTNSGLYLQRDPTVPYMLSTQSKDSLIQTYGSWVKYFRAASWIFGACAAFIVLRSLYREIKKRCPECFMTVNELAIHQAKSAAEDSQSEDLPTKFACVACCGLRNAVLVPCSHVTVCLNCVTKIQHCPVCRAHFTSYHPLIYS